MNVTEIDFGSFLTYSPYEESDIEKRSRTQRTNLKRDEYINVGSEQILTSDYFTRLLKADTYNRITATGGWGKT